MILVHVENQQILKKKIANNVTFRGERYKKRKKQQNFSEDYIDVFQCHNMRQLKNQQTKIHIKNVTSKIEVRVCHQFVQRNLKKNITSQEDIILIDVITMTNVHIKKKLKIFQFFNNLVAAAQLYWCLWNIAFWKKSNFNQQVPEFYQLFSSIL